MTTTLRHDEARRLRRGIRLTLTADQEALRQTFIARWAENDPRAYLDSVRAIAGWTVEDKINQITVPTLVITSDADTLIPREVTAPMAEQIPGAELATIARAGHLSNIEAEEAFDDLLAEHLRRCGLLA